MCIRVSLQINHLFCKTNTQKTVAKVNNLRTEEKPSFVYLRIHVLGQRNHTLFPQLWDFHFHTQLHHDWRFCRQIPSLFCMCILRLDVKTLLQQGYFFVGLLDAQWGRCAQKSHIFMCRNKKTHNTKLTSYLPS